MIVIDSADQSWFSYKGHDSYHVMSTETNKEAAKEELVEFGKQIGLPPFFIQNEEQPSMHYDIWGSKVDKALNQDVKEITTREMVNIVKAKRDASKNR